MPQKWIFPPSLPCFLQKPRGLELGSNCQDHCASFKFLMLGARTLLGAPGIATRSKDATRAPIPVVSLDSTHLHPLRPAVVMSTTSSKARPNTHGWHAHGVQCAHGLTTVHVHLGSPLFAQVVVVCWSSSSRVKKKGASRAM